MHKVKIKDYDGCEANGQWNWCLKYIGIYGKKWYYPVYLIFSFDDINDAILFVLVWG